MFSNETPRFVTNNHGDNWSYSKGYNKAMSDIMKNLPDNASDLLRRALSIVMDDRRFGEWPDVKPREKHTERVRRALATIHWAIGPMNGGREYEMRAAAREIGKALDSLGDFVGASRFIATMRTDAQAEPVGWDDKEYNDYLAVVHVIEGIEDFNKR